jgi:ubiquinone/menaquinone biosynthesis C-methylase UbiE
MKRNAKVVAEEKEAVKTVYREIAEEYDERVPGMTPADKRFVETEMAFILDKIDPSAHVLDLGCGTGRITIPMAQRACQVTGVDLSAQMIARLREKAEKLGLNVDLREADMEQLPFEASSFDVITCVLALMHIPPESRQPVFVEANRVLKPGGKMIVTVKNSVFERLCCRDRFVTVDVTDVESNQLIFTNTQSGKEFKAPWYSCTPQELDRLFSIAGLRLIHLRGNIPLVAWMSDNILEDPQVYKTVSAIENILGDIPPFNYLGYHILAEAVKPL